MSPLCDKSLRNEDWYICMNQADINKKLNKNDIIESVIYFDETDSTNNQAKAAAKSGTPGNVLYVAGCQTAGRGSRGRNWVSNADDGIWMSLLIRPQLEADKASMLTLVTALAVSAAIKNCTGIDSFIKWPNDIVISGKKVCGILTEMQANDRNILFVVIGIGINVNTTYFDDEISDKATSFFCETGQKFDKAEIIAEIIHEFTRYFKIFMETKNLNKFIDEYNSKLINAGKEVKVYGASENVMQATALGIDEEGRLLVKDTNGETVSVVAGEVSVRGLYSYV